MDDRRFDSLTRALASGKNRRGVLKGFVGLGVAAIAGGVVLDSGTEAARRPEPTPKPVACPGQQIRSGNQCICPDELEQCGPDCCPAEAACCDNTCCYGTCYGEELCCPTGHLVCHGRCGPGECCDDSDCGDRCLICNQDTRMCEARCDPETELCCATQGVCVSTGECCPDEPGCCSAEGCACFTGTLHPCDQGLVCCGAGSEFGAPATCITEESCNALLCTGIGCACEENEQCDDDLMCCGSCLPAEQC